MILPTKHLPLDRSLIGVGADVLSLLDKPKTVNKLWMDFQALSDEKNSRRTFDWFTLTISMLFSIGAVELTGTRLRRCEGEQE